MPSSERSIHQIAAAHHKSHAMHKTGATHHCLCLCLVPLAADTPSDQWCLIPCDGRRGGAALRIKPSLTRTRLSSRGNMRDQLCTKQTFEYASLHCLHVPSEHESLHCRMMASITLSPPPLAGVYIFILSYHWPVRRRRMAARRK